MNTAPESAWKKPRPVTRGLESLRTRFIAWAKLKPLSIEWWHQLLKAALLSMFVHLPWIICFGALYGIIFFLQSGISLSEFSFSDFLPPGSYLGSSQFGTLAPPRHRTMGFICLSVALAVGWAVFETARTLCIDPVWAAAKQQPRFSFAKTLFGLAAFFLALMPTFLPISDPNANIFYGLAALLMALSPMVRGGAQNSCGRAPLSCEVNAARPRAGRQRRVLNTILKPKAGVVMLLLAILIVLSRPTLIQSDMPASQRFAPLYWFLAAALTVMMVSTLLRPFGTQNTSFTAIARKFFLWLLALLLLFVGADFFSPHAWISGYGPAPGFVPASEPVPTMPTWTPVRYHIEWGAWLPTFGALAAAAAGLNLLAALIQLRLCKRGALRAYRFFLLLLPILLLFTGTYLVMHRMEWLVELGSFAVLGSGFVLLAASTQSLFVICPWLTGRPALAIPVFVAVAVAAAVAEDPIAERPNPLLAPAPRVPAAVETMAGQQCGKARISGLVDELRAEATEPKWITASSKPDPTRPLMVLISAEGGGMRAAYWTAVLLETVQENMHYTDGRNANQSLLEATGLLSGVSGGSLGLATWLAAQELPAGARLPCIHDFLSGDFLTPLAAGLLFLDLPRLVIPKFLLDKHRGDYFESYIARRWLTLTGSSFFYQPLGRLGSFPSGRQVFFNTTDALSGQPVALGTTAAPLPPGADEDSAASIINLNAGVRKRLPPSELSVAQAVHMSARFPYLSPNPDVLLDAREAAQALYNRNLSDLASVGYPLDKVRGNAPTRVASLVDGGYFDNSGLGPTLRLLEEQQAESILKTQKSPQLLVLHIFNDELRNCDARAQIEPACLYARETDLKEHVESDAWGWLKRPFSAIFAVRAQHSLQRLNELRGAIKSHRVVRDATYGWTGTAMGLLCGMPPFPFYQVVLSWTLSPREITQIEIKAQSPQCEQIPQHAFEWVLSDAEP